MTFLYSEIALEVKPMSFRYYNDLVWYWYSFIGFIPLLLLTIYKLLINPVNLDPLRKGKKIVRRWDDYMMVYFVVDFLLSTWEGSYLDPCRFILWYHHIISIVVLSKLLSKPIYFWWEAAIPMLHALIVVYPNNFVLFLYVMIVFYFNLTCYLEPYKQLYEYRFIGKFFPFMYYSFILVGAQAECSIPLPYLC